MPKPVFGQMPSVAARTSSPSSRPTRVPRLWRPLPENLYQRGRRQRRTCKRRKKDLKEKKNPRAARTAPTHLGVLRVSLHSFNSAEVQSPLGVRGQGREGGRQGRREPRRREPGGSRGRRPAGPASRSAEPGASLREDWPGGQCAFVYVARAAAASTHLKSPRVSARQSPPPNRRAAARPDSWPPLALVYFRPDVTSRADVKVGTVLGSPWWPARWVLGVRVCLFSERGVTSPLWTAQPAERRHLTPPPPPPPAPRAPAAARPLTREGRCNKSLGGGEPWCGPGSWHRDPQGWLCLAAL